MRGTSKSVSQSSMGCWLIAQALGIGILGLVTPDVAFCQAKEPVTTKASEPTTLPKASTRSLLKPGSQGAEVTELQGILKLMGYYAGAITGVYDEGTAAAVSKFQKAANLGADGVAGADTWNRLLPPSPAIAPAPAKPSTSAASNSTEAFPAPAGTKPTANATTKKPATASNSATKSSTGSDRSSSSGQESVTFPILRLGMKGPAVEGLQERLRALGYLKGSTDGVFGSETQAAVKAAQRQFKLESDGIVGASTWSGLLR